MQIFCIIFLDHYTVNSKKAKIYLELEDIDDSETKLLIQNIGKSTARNLHWELLNNVNWNPHDPKKNETEIPPNKQKEIVFSLYGDMMSNYSEIKITWEDDSGEPGEYIEYINSG